MKQREFFLKNSKGQRLAVVEEAPETAGPFPVVVLAHGYTSGKDADSCLGLVERLGKVGIATVRFDFRGHYDSEGQIEEVNISTGLEDLETIMQYVRSNESFDQDRIGIYGGSYGGVVSELYVARSPGVFAALALKAPATDWGVARANRIGEAGMTEWKNKGVYTFSYTDIDVQAPYSFYEDITSFDFYGEASAIEVPTLIVQGDVDKSIPAEFNQKLADVIGSNATIHIYKDADHFFKKEFEEVMDDLAGFLSQELGEKENG